MGENTTEKRGEVSKSFDNLVNAIEELSKRVGTLSSKISPILSIGAEKTPGDRLMESPSIYSADVAISMKTQTDKVNDMITEVNSMIRRVEL